MSSSLEHGVNLGVHRASGRAATSAVPSLWYRARQRRCKLPKPFASLHWQFISSRYITRFTLVLKTLGCNLKSPAKVSPAVLAFLCPGKEIINLLISTELGWHYLEGLNVPQLEQSPSAKTGRGLLVNIVLQIESCCWGSPWQ